MTEQPPSASTKEALDLAERIRDWQTAEWVGAKEIDALCEQRVSAERERIAYEFRIPVLALTVRPGEITEADKAWADGVIRAPAERPAPPKTEWMVDPPRGGGWEAHVFDNRRAAEIYAAAAPPHTRIVERPAPEGPQQQDSLRGIGVEQPTQETGQLGCGDHWRPGATAPREHGVEIRIKIAHARGVPAYWDAGLQTFVLSRPVNVESVREPLGWQPLPSALASTGDLAAAALELLNYADANPSDFAFLPIRNRIEAIRSALASTGEQPDKEEDFGEGSV